MAITKERKHELVTQYKELLKTNTGLILTSCSGLSVKEIEGLRGKIREVGGVFHIVKNNLIELALKETDLPFPEGALIGPTAIGFATEDVVGVAKAIVDLANESEAMFVKGAVIDRIVYDDIQVRRIASLPPMNMVQAQFLSLLQTPASRLAGVVAASIRQVVNVIKSYSESEPAAV